MVAFFVVVMLGVMLVTILWILAALIITVHHVLPVNMTGLEFLVVLTCLVVFMLEVVAFFLEVTGIT